MKALKIIGVILLILIGLPLLISLFLPSKVHVERFRIIDAPREVVYQQVNVLKNWEKWSPWHQIDPKMKLTYSGPDSGEGASYSWTSEHENVGNGKVTIIKSIPHDSIIIAMDFMENGKATGSYHFEPTEKGTKVTWGMDSDMGGNPIGKWFGLFMDKMVGPDFEKGLANLETAAKQASSHPGSAAISIQSVTTEGFPAITIRTKANPSDFSRSIGQTYIELLAFMRMNNIEQSGPPFAIYHNHTASEIDMEPGIPVKTLPKVTNGKIKALKVNKGNAVVANFYGSWEKTGVAHKAIDEWVREHNKKVTGSPWEVYVTDPSTEPDTSKWLTKVYYPVE